MNARKLKKNDLFFFLENNQLLNFEEKKMAPELFEFVEKYIIFNFLLKLPQFEKTGCIEHSQLTVGKE